MTRDRIVRVALWATIAFNALGVAAFTPVALGFPSTAIPIAVPPFLAAQMAFVIALFGAVYAWLARQPRINRPLLVVGALGKAGFFLITLGFALTGEVPVSMALNATPDLAFAAVFLWWAVTAA